VLLAELAKFQVIIAKTSMIDQVLIKACANHNTNTLGQHFLAGISSTDDIVLLGPYTWVCASPKATQKDYIPVCLSIILA